jgi:hypothetical protein
MWVVNNHIRIPFCVVATCAFVLLLGRGRKMDLGWVWTQPGHSGGETPFAVRVVKKKTFVLILKPIGFPPVQI